MEFVQDKELRQRMLLESGIFWFCIVGISLVLVGILFSQGGQVLAGYLFLCIPYLSWSMLPSIESKSNILNSEDKLFVTHDKYKLNLEIRFLHEGVYVIGSDHLLMSDIKNIENITRDNYRILRLTYIDSEVVKDYVYKEMSCDYNDVVTCIESAEPVVL